jgi:cytochrome P450/ferredoxin-NADP reductase
VTGQYRDLFGLDPKAVRSPFDALDDLRAEPVRYVSELTGFVVAGHAEALQVLADVETYSSRSSTGPTSPTAIARLVQAGALDLTGLSEPERARLLDLAKLRSTIAGTPALVNADGPEHARQRTAITSAFDPARIAEFGTHAADVARDLTDRFADAGRVEFVQEFSRPFAARTTARLIGISDLGDDQIARWSDAFIAAIGRSVLAPRELLEMFERIGDFYDYFTERLGDGGGGALLAAVASTGRSDSPDESRAVQLQMLSGIVVAAYTTVRDLLSSAVLRLATSEGAERLLRSDMSRLPEFVEEVLRLEAPTAGVYRATTHNTRLGGVDIPAGSFVFINLLAANLDPSAFETPREIGYDRPQRPAHLSFGHGVHSCVASHLARMIASAGLEAVLARVSNLAVEIEPGELIYRASWASRTVLALPLSFTSSSAPVEAAIDPEHRPMVVTTHRLIADRILEIVFSSGDGGPLPQWEPGAHVEIQLPSGAARQYSLCGDPRDDSSWTVAVLEETDGRGGSAELHAVAKTGAQELFVRPPRNNFPLKDAPRYLFVAGGIGVTPILTMVEEVQRRGASWQLVYGGRNRQAMAYLDRIAAYPDENVELWPEDERGRPDLEALLRAQDAQTEVYACGPGGLLDALAEAHTRVQGLAPLRTERFSAAGPVDVSGGAFEVVLAKSGTSLIVEEGTSVLTTVRTVVPRLSFSCEEGYCGECETRVLEGTPDHRDDFLDDEEQESGETMMICVSRCKGRRLVLDL